MQNSLTNGYFRSLSTGLIACLFVAGQTQADDWMTWASSYTHEPANGQRIDQFARAAQPIALYRDDFVRSGYRNFRSTLQAGQSADNIHIVEQWGGQVIPYEQWRFPYRPYAVPYDAWGPQAPYGILNGSFGLGLGVPPGYGMPPQSGGIPSGIGTNPGNPSRGFPLTPLYNNEPWYDGTQPTAPPLDPRSDEEFFYRPPD